MPARPADQKEATMSVHSALRRAFTGGGEVSTHEIIGRTSQRREIARGGDCAVYGEPAPVRDPDAEAGRGRLGQAY
jgi:hypothetical protein